MASTTIQLDKSLVDALKKSKDHPRQSYNELIKKMVHVYTGLKKRNQYDEFLHKVQQDRMRELWDNKSDEAWENA